MSLFIRLISCECSLAWRTVSRYVNKARLPTSVSDVVRDTETEGEISGQGPIETRFPEGIF